MQEPTPTTGDAFGSSVGFDTGALIVGAAGAIGSGLTGAEAVDLYQPGAQVAVSSVTAQLARAQRFDHRQRHVHRRQPGGRPHGHDRLGRWVCSDGRRPAGRLVRLRRPARLHDRTGRRVVHDWRDLERHLRQDRVGADDGRHQQPGTGIRGARPGVVVDVDRGRGRGQRQWDGRQPRRQRHQHRRAQLGRRVRADHDRPARRPGHIRDKSYLLEQSRGGWVRD